MLKFAFNLCSQEQINDLVHYFRENPEVKVLLEAQEVLHNVKLVKNGIYRKPAEDLFAKIKKKSKIISCNNR